MIEVTHVHRLHPQELQEMQEQFNCNLAESENNESWFDKEDFPCHITILDDVQFFQTYVE